MYSDSFGAINDTVIIHDLVECSSNSALDSPRRSDTRCIRGSSSGRWVATRADQDARSRWGLRSDQYSAARLKSDRRADFLTFAAVNRASKANVFCGNTKSQAYERSPLHLLPRTDIPCEGAHGAPQTLPDRL